MTLKWDNGVVRLYHGSARDMAFLADESVDCVVTSPPYWGLRDYGLEPEVWDGQEGCEHEWGGSLVTYRGHKGDRSSLHSTNTDQLSKEANQHGSFCSLCGAWRGTLGLEPLPSLYVQHTVQVFSEVWRVLKPTGTVWLNLGDSYAGSGGAHTLDHANPGISRSAHRNGFSGYVADKGRGQHKNAPGLKPKDLVLIPERVAIALQEDGWWVRSKIAWCKKAPMPESITDRPTSAWEIIWVLNKEEHYFWDKEAVREPQVSTHPSGNGFKRLARLSYLDDNGPRGADGQWEPSDAGRNMRNYWIISPEPMGWEMCQHCGMVYNPGQYRRLGRLVAPLCEIESGEEKAKIYVTCKRCGEWDRWMSHFATFPQAVVEPCILAGTSEKGNCAECGKPWERVMEKVASTMNIRVRDNKKGIIAQKSGVDGQYRASDKEMEAYGPEKMGHSSTLAWQPTCKCGSESTIPAVVLDPFAGSGTVAMVAQKLGRRSVGVDASEPYLNLAQERIGAVPLPLILQEGGGDGEQTQDSAQSMFAETPL